MCIRDSASPRKSAELAGVSSLKRPTRKPEAGRLVATRPAAPAQRWHASAPGCAGGGRAVSASSSRASQPRAGSSCTSIPAP
eukprot:3170415-Pyramimonas_sp.AAC.1